jgi:hypothetical protein
MFLKSFQIINYRCIENITIDFKKGVNVLVGENNTGKTTIIDALRLAFGIGTQRKDIFFNLDDFHINKFGKRSEIAEFHLIFSDIRGTNTPYCDNENRVYIRFGSQDRLADINKIKELLNRKLEGNEIVEKVIKDPFKDDPEVKGKFPELLRAQLLDSNVQLASEKRFRLLIISPQNPIRELFYPNKENDNKTTRIFIDNTGCDSSVQLQNGIRISLEIPFKEGVTADTKRYTVVSRQGVISSIDLISDINENIGTGKEEKRGFDIFATIKYITKIIKRSVLFYKTYNYFGHLIIYCKIECGYEASLKFGDRLFKEDSESKPAQKSTIEIYRTADVFELENHVIEFIHNICLEVTRCFNLKPVIADNLKKVVSDSYNIS